MHLEPASRVIYKETPLRTSAELIERVAVVLSKRPQRSEFAAFLFSELISESGASHAIIWKRENLESNKFVLFQASCQSELTENFDPTHLGFWGLWESGSASAYMLEGQHEFMKDGNYWTRSNLLLPLSNGLGHMQGILSLHYTGEGPDDSEIRNVLSSSLGKIIAYAMFGEKLDQEQESSRQIATELWYEHNLRMILARVHLKLDRDYVLQSAVDSLGTILKVSSCLILRLEQNATRITHEYVDTELSPLGLGWSSCIPEAIAEQMSEKTTVLEETAIRRHEQGNYVEGMESLYESSIRSLAGTPLTLDGGVNGALLVQSSRERKWLVRELQLLESTALAIGTAIKNAEAYQEAKEQVFNLTLLSNLTRQLGTAVEQLGKVKNDEEESAVASLPMKTPLSARELEVLRLIAAGMSNREIAQRLFLTESTVELHASRIRKKLKLKSRTALVKFACDHRLT